MAAAAVRTVMHNPAPVLRQVAKAVDDISHPKVVKLVEDLVTTAASFPALGLAAPQVGESLRVFAMRTPRAFYSHPMWSDDGDYHYTAVINPVITARSSQLLLGPEACLSMPDEQLMVPRATVLGVKYWTLMGEERSHSLTGLPAVVFQHELDHLDGVLMCDRAVTEEEKKKLEESGKSFEAMEDRAYDRFMAALQRDFVWEDNTMRPRSV